MLFPEEKKTYETKIGSTKFIVTSESLPNAQQDILDSLSRLMVRDCGDVYDPKATLPSKPPTQADAEHFKKAWDRAHGPIQWDVEKDEGK